MPAVYGNLALVDDTDQIIPQTYTECSSGTGLFGFGVWNAWSSTNATTTNTTTEVWGGWCQDIYGSTTTSTASVTINTSGIVYNNNAWQEWTIQEVENKQLQEDVWKYGVGLVVQSQEERLAELTRLRNQQADYERRNIEAKNEKAADDARAIALLKSLLTKEQLEFYEKEKYVQVITKKGNVYHITRGWSHNVYEVKQGKRVSSLCCHPTHLVPLEDNMVAQKLLLEDNEDNFRKMANIGRFAA